MTVNRHDLSVSVQFDRPYRVAWGVERMRLTRWFEIRLKKSYSGINPRKRKVLGTRIQVRVCGLLFLFWVRWDEFVVFRACQETSVVRRKAVTRYTEDVLERGCDMVLKVKTE